VDDTVSGRDIGLLPILNRFLDYSELTADMARAPDRPAYILCGEEDYLIQQVTKRLLRDMVPPGAEMIDLVKIAGDGQYRSVNWERVISEIATPPFISAKKVLILTDTGLFSSSPGTGRDAEKLELVLTSVPASCCLIFAEKSVVSNNRFLRRMRESGAVSGKLDRQSPADLARWVSGLCAREKLRITREAAESLMARCEFSMSDIAAELSTVILSFQFESKTDICLEDINNLCREDMTGKIFDLTDAIADRRIDDALHMLDVFRARREAPLYILSMLARQSRDLLLARECGRAERLISSGITKSSFYARKLTNQAKRFTFSQLESMMEGCFQADLAIKTGRLDEEDAVTIIVIRACEAV